MILENPTIDATSYAYCAIRKRKADGTRNVGGMWLEPMGMIGPFVEDQKQWEVVLYENVNDSLPA